MGRWCTSASSGLCHVVSFTCNRFLPMLFLWRCIWVHSARWLWVDSVSNEATLSILLRSVEVEVWPSGSLLLVNNREFERECIEDDKADEIIPVWIQSFPALPVANCCRGFVKGVTNCDMDTGSTVDSMPDRVSALGVLVGMIVSCPPRSLLLLVIGWSILGVGWKVDSRERRVPPDAETIDNKSMMSAAEQTTPVIRSFAQNLDAKWNNPPCT